MLKRLFEYPYMRDVSLDDPSTTILRRRIIREKLFLRKLYKEWYTSLISQIPCVSGKIVELGSGGGYLDEMLPECISSEIFFRPDIDVVLDGCFLPFGDSSLSSIVLVDVFHHISDVREFLAEAQRTLQPGGAVTMIEPWNTLWASFVYRHFHVEPFEPEAVDWRFASTGPLSGANAALPWIVFCRDRDLFHADFPGLRIESITLDYFISYLVSGGVSFRSFFPGWSYDLFRSLERMLAPVMRYLAMFARIVVRRVEDGI